MTRRITAAPCGAAEMPSPDALVVFTPSGRRGRFPRGTPVLQAAQQLGVDLDSVCGGRGMCGRCQVLLSAGRFAKHGLTSRTEHLSEPGDTEEEYREIYGMEDGRRLGCSAQILGDVVIDVPPDSQVHRQVVRKDAEVMDINLNPVIRIYYVEVQQPDMHDPAGDLWRLKKALEFEWRLEDLVVDIGPLHDLQGALRAGEWKVTVAVHHGPRADRIIAVWPGFRARAYGIAVDVGSTTIAAHLCDLSSGEVAASAGAMNPQIRFGEDLMSRVSYVMMNPGGDKEMTRAVREAVQKLAEETAAAAGIGVGDILDVTFVGNPIMHHLLLGISPVELGGAPFALATDEALSLWASELDLRLHPNARVFVLPCIAGHVGADTAAVALSEAPHLRDEISLIVDVGTNAEILLGNRRRILAASSPTGPAFEGAQISCGQRAAPGAVERVRIDRETLEPRFKVIGCDAWSDDPAFTAGSAGVGVTGICGSGIIEALAEMFLTGIISADGVIDGALAARTPRIVKDGRTFQYVLHRGGGEGGGRALRITQNDVRAVQLAKAALYAGVKLLMDHLDVPAVERIRLAGAFGSHIDVKYAMVLGLIPDCELSQVSSAGNAAGAGARIALLDGNSRTEISAAVCNIEKIETAVEPRFQEHFVDAMAIPHKSDAFPHLARAVDLPPPKISTAQPGAGKKRRRRPA